MGTFIKHPAKKAHHYFQGNAIRYAVTGFVLSQAELARLNRHYSGIAVSTIYVEGVTQVRVMYEVDDESTHAVIDIWVRDHKSETISLKESMSFK